MKPGIRSTEFWVTLALQVVGILLLTGIITPEQAGVLQEAAPEAANLYTQGFALVTMVLSAFGYSISRGIAKKNGK